MTVNQPTDEDPFSRTLMLLGPTALDILERSKVAVFGVGGVGGYATEVLARSGIGELHLIDNDTVNASNINRQIYALHSTLGRLKVEVAMERIHDINPSCRVHTYPIFYLPENADAIDLSRMDYVVDCIDTVTAKIELARRCHSLGVRLISSMGAANKMDPTGFRVSDISKTKMDPLAKAIRQKLRKMGIPHLKVVYSEETPLRPLVAISESNHTPTESQRRIPASNAFVPAAAGLVVGSEVVKDLIGYGRDNSC